MGGTFALVGFNEGNQFAENLADVAPVDLVDDHRELLLRFTTGALTQFLEYSITDFVAHLPAFRSFVEHRAQALDEFLVAVRLMERNEALTLGASWLFDG